MKSSKQHIWEERSSKIGSGEEREEMFGLDQEVR